MQILPAHCTLLRITGVVLENIRPFAERGLLRKVIQARGSEPTAYRLGFTIYVMNSMSVEDEVPTSIG